MASVDTRDSTQPGDLSALAARVDASPVEFDVAREVARRGLFGIESQTRSISRFTLRRKVGSGGMGDVYAAHDPELDRTVAVKLITDGALQPGGANASSYVEEARAMAKVSHPNVVAVYEAGVVDATESDAAVVYVAMEFVDGQTLRTWVGVKPRRWPQIVAAYVQAGRGLAAVHAAGLVHRDFKPDNVLIGGEDERVKVTDFGLARMVQDEATIRTEGGGSGVGRAPYRTQSRAGTLKYMAPEQLAEGITDAASDQFSFCVALCEAVYGKRPYQGASALELAAAFINPAPELPRTPLPRRIRAALRRGLSVEPSERWPSMDALLAVLTPRRRRWTSAAGVAVGIVGLSWGAWVTANADARCEASSLVFAQTWDEAARARLQATFDGTEVAYASETARVVSHALDDYGDAWAVEHEAACRATRIDATQSEARLDLRIRCLERRRSEVEALLAALAKPSALSVENAPTAVEHLLAPARCQADAYLGANAQPPADDAQAAEIDSLRSRLDRLEIAWVLGEEETVRVEALEVLAAARRVDSPPLLADALVFAGKLSVGVGEYTDAKKLLEEAYSTGRAADNPTAATAAAIRLVMGGASGAASEQADEAWLRIARAEIDAHGLVDFESELFHAEAAMRTRSGDYRSAIEAELAGIAAMKKKCEQETCALLASLYRGLAYDYDQIGSLDDGLGYAKLAVDTATSSYPAGHPAIALAQLGYGRSLGAQDRYSEAIEPLEEAHRIHRQNLAEGSPNRATTAAILGFSYAQIGRSEEGIRLLEQAVSEARVFGDALHIAAILNQIAQVYNDAGRIAEARTAWRDAVTVLRDGFPDGHPGIGVFLAGIARSLGKEGKHDEALPLFQEAFAAREASGPPTPNDAPLHVTFAASLEALNRTDDALAHAQRAAALTAEGPLTRPAVLANRMVIRLIAPTDPAAATLASASLAARCDALNEAARTAVGCVTTP